MKKIKLLTILALLGVAGVPSTGIAKIYAWTYGMYLNQTEKEEGVKNEEVKIFRNASVGFTTQSGFLLGGSYCDEEIKEKRTTDDTRTETKKERTSLGPTVGYSGKTLSSPFIYFTYFPSSTLETESSVSGNIQEPIKDEGEGYQFGLGYRHSFGRIQLSFHLTYNLFKYQRRTRGTVQSELTPESEESNIFPYVGLWSHF